MEILIIFCLVILISGLPILIVLIAGEKWNGCFYMIALISISLVLFASSFAEIDKDKKIYIKETYSKPEFEKCRPIIETDTIHNMQFHRYLECVERVKKINEYKKLREGK